MGVLLECYVAYYYTSRFSGMYILIISINHFEVRFYHTFIINHIVIFIHLQFILVFNWIEYKPASYGYYVYPMWADAVGWILGVLPVIVVVLMAIDQICSGPDDLTIMEVTISIELNLDQYGIIDRFLDISIIAIAESTSVVSSHGGVGSIGDCCNAP